MVAHITGEDASDAFRKKLEDAIGGYFKDGAQITRGIVDDYRAAWEIRRQARAVLSGDHGDRPSTKGPLDSVLMTASWSRYVGLVKERGMHAAQRVDLLTTARRAFSSTPRFADMTRDERYIIAPISSSASTDRTAGACAGASARCSRE